MTPDHCCDLAPAIFTPDRPWALRLVDRYLAAQALNKQYQALLRLDDSLLRDIGITRAQAVKQATKPVWDAPQHWKS